MFYYRLTAKNIYPSPYNIAMISKITANDGNTRPTYVRVDSYEYTGSGQYVFDENPADRWQTDRYSSFPHYMIFRSEVFLYELSIRSGESGSQYVIKDFNISYSESDLPFTDPGWISLYDGVMEPVAGLMQSFIILPYAHLLKSGDKYYKYLNNEFIEVPLSSESFETNRMDLSLITQPTNKVIYTLKDGNENEGGKIYRQNINVSRFGRVRSISIH